MIRDEQGKFKKGQSGNPSGRPSSNLCSVRNSLRDGGELVAKTVLEKALTGDMAACKLVLERVCPALKPVWPAIQMTEPIQDSPKGIAQRILTSAMQGEMSPDIASNLVNSVGVLSRVIETEELRSRIESLERAIVGKKK